ncbi:TetR/AcrR family transcriptional regulator [Solirubrobacter sp. CPCC 204708]|uniref:TetR/AcrR family transcriptional regulator n=1 Tax=Solirubrobacter deserti TaxID=2282478 RepID=A0ABT4RM64_9ACTN|nr:TetR/AcrR family transcriptional regulator [Solirubrobacter deserti]MBE2316757.1 TetR/AcrR family transcriptional regulator [Solirubrobacter deserti]MDA0139513.1 TetR/AcrR family transcriptional regulator [Solirubrobacter deserti]
MNESRTRTRTRRAILDAAVTVLARDAGASLGEVASAAGVGRTTVHRYFAERADLLRALIDYANERVGEATARAELTHGSAADALARLCREYFELGDVLTVMFTGAIGNMEDEPEQPHDRELVALIHRGREEGTLDPALSEAWTLSMLWALLYTAWSLMREQSMPRHEALDQCLVCLHKAVAAP